MVALFNGVGGGAAALISLAEFHNRVPAPGNLHVDTSLAIVLSALIGSVSFSGSMVAFAKLQELIQGRPITYPGQKVGNLVLLGAAAALGVAICAGWEAQWALVALIALALALRRPVRAPDRRRRHAGRDLAAERVHRPRGGGDRLRAREQRPDRERHARRRVGHLPDDDDGQGDEPLDRERALRRVRAGHGGGRGDGGRRDRHRARRERRRRRDHARVRAARDHRPGLRDGRRAGAARRAPARRPARGEGRQRRVRDPPGRRPHAGAHERPARRGERAVHGS